MHLLDALLASADQEGVLEQHPGGVLQPTPFIDDLDAVDGLRKEDAAQEMIGGDDGRSGHQHPPIAVKRQECERAKDVEMRLDAPAAKMNEHGPDEHLRHADQMAGERRPGSQKASNTGRLMTAPTRKSAVHT